MHRHLVSYSLKRTILKSNDRMEPSVAHKKDIAKNWIASAAAHTANSEVLQTHPPFEYPRKHLR